MHSGKIALEKPLKATLKLPMLLHSDKSRADRINFLIIIHEFEGSTLRFFQTLQIYRATFSITARTRKIRASKVTKYDPA